MDIGWKRCDLFHLIPEFMIKLKKSTDFQKINRNRILKESVFVRMRKCTKEQSHHSRI